VVAFWLSKPDGTAAKRNLLETGPDFIKFSGKTQFKG
jgi:hypothetical protein